MPPPFRSPIFRHHDQQYLQAFIIKITDRGPRRTEQFRAACAPGDGVALTWITRVVVGAAFPAQLTRQPGAGRWRPLAA